MAEQEEEVQYEEGAEEVYADEDGAEYQEEEEQAEGAEAGAGGDEDLEALRRKLKEMEEEAARLKGAGSADGAGTTAAAAAAAATTAADEQAKAEVDARSVYIGSVDYSCTPEELQQHFAQCGTVNRVTILTDKFGNPKGYAYLEFLEVDAVQNAVLLDNSELRGRHIKVTPKRTNLPGLRARGGGRGRGRFPAYGGRGGGHYAPPYAGGRGRGGYHPYGGAPGYPPRGRGRGRFYAPY